MTLKKKQKKIKLLIILLPLLLNNNSYYHLTLTTDIQESKFSKPYLFFFYHILLNYLSILIDFLIFTFSNNTFKYFDNFLELLLALFTDNYSQDYVIIAK